MIAVSVVFHHEYSAGGERRGRNRDMIFKNINLYSDSLPKMKFSGYDNTHKTEKILVSHFCLNGEPIASLPQSNWNIGEFAEDIRLE